MSSWTREDLSALKAAARKYADREKNDRWRKVGQKLGRPKRECYEKYKQLKREREEERGAGSGGSTSRPTSSSSLTKPNTSSSSSKYSDEGSKHQGEHKYATATPTTTTDSLSYKPPPKRGGIGNFFEDEDDEEQDSDDGGFRIDYNAGSSGGSGGGGGGSSKGNNNTGASGSTAKRRAIICTERDPRVLDVASRCSSASIEISEAADVRQLLFGGRRIDCFNKAWTEQGFYFNTIEGLGCGLVQNEGGPCGVIAAVQAHVVKHLLFSSTSTSHSSSSFAPSTFSSSSSSSSSFNNTDWANPSRGQQENALLDALSEILWRIAETASLSGRGNPQATVALASRHGGRAGRTQGYKPDGLTETLSLYNLSSKTVTRDFLDAHLKMFMEPSGYGACLLTYSIMFTRGLDNVRSDMDKMIDVPSLIGRHNYAAQEMVNLMLCGKAHSNVFDGKQDMGGMMLRGIPHQTDIGMLTLFEHYGHVRVGKNMKLPKYPIWVLCRESHYSVLFSSNKDEVKDPLSRRGGHMVDLFYYDELAKQEEMYRLSVNMPEYNPDDDDEDGSGSKHRHDADLTPPIDHVIRTHWKQATVDWNGSEALL